MARKSSKSKAPRIPEANRITIRMYKHGLGDCFLLAFPSKADAKTPVYVLIDCGVLQKTDREGEKLLSVFDDLIKTTGGTIDLLIVTHEHWDHVAGFSYANELLESGKLTFKRVWLSWAENLSDPTARAVYDDLARKKKAVSNALKLASLAGVDGRLRAAAGQNDVSARRLQGQFEAARSTLRFLDEDDTPDPPAASKPKGAEKARPKKFLTLGKAMDWVRARVKPGDFRSPGECLPLPGADGVKVYVLGPPKDEAMIKMMDARGEQDFELAADRFGLLGMDLDERIAGLAARAGSKAGPDDDPADDEARPRSSREPNRSPFELRFQVPLEEARKQAFFRSRYGFDDDPMADPAGGWRRIDDEWLISGIGQLALQIDSRTNNTSLALTFELPGGRTLIFPGDAQFGNWKSWDDLKFVDEDQKALPTTTAKLLERAVFYKVGHHGSHNATRYESLKKMTSGRLVAMIPTDYEFGLKQGKDGWQMPRESLEKMLKEVTKERVIRADRLRDSLTPAFQPDVFQSDRPLLPDLPAGQFPIHVEYDVPLRE